MDIGFIFDFDGTLYDDIDLADTILQRLVQDFNVNLSDEEIHDVADQVIRATGKFSGRLYMAKLFLFVAKHFGIPLLKRIKFLKKTDEYYKEEAVKCPLMPKSREVLSELRKYGKIGLSSNTPSEEIRRRLADRIDFLDLFSGPKSICTGDMVENYKPDPEALLKIMGKWKIPAKNVFMVGDMTSDMEAAQNAGSKTIAVLSGFDSREDLEKYNPDFIIDSVADIPSILDDVLSLID